MANPYVYPPFEALVARVIATRETRWSAIEDAFLATVATFDAIYAAGQMADGDYRTAKSWTFNRLIALLLQNRTGRAIQMGGGCKRPGLAYTHQLDLAYPGSELPAVALGETKIAGTPPHAGNVKSAGESGRRGSADIDKRLYETSLTAIDLKRAATAGPLTLARTGAARHAAPLYVVFYAARVINQADFANTVAKLRTARDYYIDAACAFIYGASVATAPTTYVKMDAGAGLRIDEVLESFSARVLGS